LTTAASAVIVSIPPASEHAELGLQPMTIPTSAPEVSSGPLMSLAPTRSTGGRQPFAGLVTFGDVGCEVDADARGIPASGVDGRDAVGLVFCARTGAAAADECPVGLWDMVATLEAGDFAGIAEGVAVVVAASGGSMPAPRPVGPGMGIRVGPVVVG
jgi:hypothetical protein